MGGFIAERLASATHLMDGFFHRPDFWWVVVGFGGQLLFMLRFLVQWIASEKAGRSVVPHIFWYFSIGGGVVLLSYAVYRADPVFIFGQALGLLVYVRNLQLIRREEKRRRQELTAG